MRKSFKSFQSSRHFLHSNLGDEAAQMIFAEILIFEDGEKSWIEILIEIPNWRRIREKRGRGYNQGGYNLEKKFEKIASLPPRAARKRKLAREEETR